jgi:hypothetical protein
MPIRLAGEGTFALLRSMAARARVEANASGLTTYLGEEVQVDSHLVRVKVDLRMGRGGRPALYATFLLNGRRRGLNHVVKTLDGC